MHPVVEAPDDALPPVSSALRIAAGLPAGCSSGPRIDKRGGERAFASRSTHIGGVGFVDKPAEQQILLASTWFLIGRIGEPFIATGDGDGTGLSRPIARSSSKRPGITPEQTRVGGDDSGRIPQRHPCGG